MHITLKDIEAASEIVYADMAPTLQHCWPLLSARLGTEVWVKHENHTPVGAFKIRGGLVYFADLAARRAQGEQIAGVISATRGNHGQSVGYAAQRYGIPATIVVPHGNSVEKNAAMRAFGVELLEHGDDFQAAREYAQALAVERHLHMVPSMGPLLVAGVATYSLELLQAVADIDVVYVPIGLGSGICGVIRARDALGLATRVVGVVAENAPAYALSLAEGRPVSTNSADTMADGMACRVPVAAALEEIMAGAERIVTVGDDAIAAAMRHYFSDTHNIAEGAGAAPLAALLHDGPAVAGTSAGLILSGGNVDRDVYAAILAAA